MARRWTFWLYWRKITTGFVRNAIKSIHWKLSSVRNVDCLDRWRCWPICWLKTARQALLNWSSLRKEGWWKSSWSKVKSIKKNIWIMTSRGWRKRIIQIGLWYHKNGWLSGNNGWLIETKIIWKILYRLGQYAMTTYLLAIPSKARFYLTSNSKSITVPFPHNNGICFSTSTLVAQLSKDNWKTYILKSALPNRVLWIPAV